MKASPLLAHGTVIGLLMILTGIAAHGQVAPATPKDFTSRIVGGGTSTVGVMHPPQSQERIMRTVSHFIVGESRQWKSNDGKTLLGKLIAFEDVTVETKIAADAKPEPEPPPMPEKLTVVKDAKARLMVDNKIYEVPLERLSEDDQKFINAIKAAIDAKAAAKKN